MNSSNVVHYTKHKNLKWECDNCHFKFCDEVVYKYGKVMHVYPAREPYIAKLFPDRKFCNERCALLYTFDKA